MSIHPKYAESILDGKKRVEFRKRRLAPDVSVVLLYATMPVGRVIGVLEVEGYDVGSPSALWERHKAHAGISRAAFRDYYRGTKTAVALLVRDPKRLPRAISLRELDPDLRPPQSFLYIELNPREFGELIVAPSGESVAQRG